MTPDSKNHSTPRPCRAHRLALSSLLAVGVAFSLSACGDGSPEQRHAPINQGVEITGEWLSIETTSNEIASWFPGTVTASRQAPVASRMSGFVLEINVDEGNNVRKGDTLLLIDQSSLDSRIRQAEANLAKARAGLENARREHERFERLYEQEAVPKQQYDQVRTALESARSNHAAAQAAVEEARSGTDYTRIQAPFDGTIVKRMAEVGELASPGQPLLVLHGAGQREIRVQVDDQAFARLPVGSHTPVTYRDRSGEERRFLAEVITAVGAADPITRTRTVKLSVPAEVELDPGQYVLVHVAIDQRQSIIVATDVIHHRAGISGVFVLDAQDRAHFRVVRLGQRSDGEVVVLSGLEEGDRVVTRASGHLGNGVTVRSEQAS